jgi:hypothetical protein
MKHAGIEKKGWVSGRVVNRSRDYLGRKKVLIENDACLRYDESRIKTPDCSATGQNPAD